MAREARPRTLEMYQDEDGRQPFIQWYMAIRDHRTKVRIERRLDRVQTGNFGDHRSVGEGVFELRMFFGPGYRVYFAEDGDTVVVLLCGGDKSSQDEDIKRAKAYWKNYEERKP